MVSGSYICDLGLTPEFHFSLSLNLKAVSDLFQILLLGRSCGCGLELYGSGIEKGGKENRRM